MTRALPRRWFGWRRLERAGTGDSSAMHNYIPMIPPPRWQDLLDVIIVAYVIYRVALLIRGTRTMQMVLGMVIVGGAFVASQVLGLITLNWLLNNFLGSLFVILVVIFSSHIRYAP